VHPSLDRLNPLGLGTRSDFSGAVLLALFIYWSWDTAVSVNEETRDRERTPGRAAIVLLGIYAIVGIACLAYVGPKQLTAASTIDEDDDPADRAGDDRHGDRVGRLLLRHDGVRVRLVLPPRPRAHGARGGGAHRAAGAGWIMLLLAFVRTSDVAPAKPSGDDLD